MWEYFKGDKMGTHKKMYEFFFSALQITPKELDLSPNIPHLPV